MRRPENIDKYDEWAEDKIIFQCAEILTSYGKSEDPIVYLVEESSAMLNLLRALLNRNHGIEKTMDYLKIIFSNVAFELAENGEIAMGKLSLDDLQDREKFFKIREDCFNLTEEESTMIPHALLYHGVKVRLVDSSTGRYVIGMIDRIEVDGIVLILPDEIPFIVGFEDLHRLLDQYQPGDRILAKFQGYGEIFFPAEVLKSNGNGTYQIMFLDDTDQSNMQSGVKEADITWDDDHKPLKEWKKEELEIVTSNLSHGVSHGGKKIETLEQYRNLKRGDKAELLNIISNALISMYFSKTHNEIDNKVLELFKKGNIITIT